MKQNRNLQSGFGLVIILIVIVALIVVAGVGAYVFHHDDATKPKVNSTSSTNTTAQSKTTTTGSTKQTDPYAGWRTFTDNASVNTSGISIKYPSDWQVNATATKTYAWSIAQTANTHNIITVSYVFQNGSQTAQQEWQACDGTDSCGGSADDKTLSGSESTINGLNAYTATVQNSYGSYHVTVIRGNKPASQGTPYVQFMTYTSDQAALSTFNKIMASATFPN